MEYVKKWIGEILEGCTHSVRELIAPFRKRGSGVFAMSQVRGIAIDLKKFYDGAK